MSETQTAVTIKGIREGLLVTLNDGPLPDLLEELEKELTAKASFLQGSRIALAVGKRPLRREQLSQIQALCEQYDLTLWAVLAEREVTKIAARHLELATRLAGSQTDLDGNALPDAVPASSAATPPPPTDSAGLLLKETIRSGRSIYYEGHVAIIGDVNPGAEIIAAGDVIVWGRLRGLVHAGAMGDETAVICALDLNPTQLRIADQIAIPPDTRRGTAVPEQAAIREGQIVAEPWPTR